MSEPLRVILAHTFYRQPGGEDVVFHSEEKALREAGHRVWTFTLHNDDIADGRPLRAAVDTVWNGAAARRVRQMVSATEADVVHFHNTFPLMSPACLRAARAAGAAVVQTLHNYRLYCPAGTFLRDGAPCHSCTESVWPWPAVRHGCYRGSRPASAVAASMLGAHRALGTWRHRVDRFIALSEHGRKRFAALGLPEELLSTKPNFVSPDPGPGPGPGERPSVLFVGRLSEEKGVQTVLDAAARLQGSVDVRVIGRGPLDDAVRRAEDRCPGLTWIGSVPHEEVLHEMGRALAVLVPSVWDEPFGRTVVEAFAKSTPVIASRTGALPELVGDGVNGLLVPPGDADAVVGAVRSLRADPDRAARMRASARATFLDRFTEARNVAQLVDIYRQALARRRGEDAEVRMPASLGHREAEGALG